MRLIDAYALKKKAQMRGHVFKNAMVTAYHMCVSTHDIDDAPTVDAEPVRHGRWLDKGWDGDFSWRIDGRGNCWRVFECSECGGKLCGNPKTNFCPNCGAKMDEEVQ